MKTKRRAESVIFNSRLLIGLCVFLFTVFLVALAEFATANPQLNLASRKPDATQGVTLKPGFAKGHSARAQVSRPLGGQCVTLRDPIVTLSTSPDIAFVDTVPAAFN